MEAADRHLGRRPGSKHRNVGSLVRALILMSATVLIEAAQTRASDAPSGPVPIVVLDLDYVDTSGEVRDQRQEHETRLRRFSDALRSDLARSGKYRIVTAKCGSAPCTTTGSQPSELLAQARDAGARLLLMGGIHKESTLLEWAKIQVVDLEANRLVLDKLLTFRGDTDEAWDRAEAFAAAEVTALPSAR